MGFDEDGSGVAGLHQEFVKWVRSCEFGFREVAGAGGVLDKESVNWVRSCKFARFAGACTAARVHQEFVKWVRSCGSGDRAPGQGWGGGVRGSNCRGRD